MYLAVNVRNVEVRKKNALAIDHLTEDHAGQDQLVWSTEMTALWIW